MSKRLAAVEASLAQGRLLVLDGWPADAQRPPLPDRDGPRVKNGPAVTGAGAEARAVHADALDRRVCVERIGEEDVALPALHLRGVVRHEPQEVPLRMRRHRRALARLGAGRAARRLKGGETFTESVINQRLGGFGVFRVGLAP